MGTSAFVARLCVNGDADRVSSRSTGHEFINRQVQKGDPYKRQRTEHQRVDSLWAGWKQL